MYCNVILLPTSLPAFYDSNVIFRSNSEEFRCLYIFPLLVCGI